VVHLDPIYIGQVCGSTQLIRVHSYGFVKAKFHYAIQLATSSRAGLQPARELDSVMKYDLNRSATKFEISRHDEIARICLRKVGNHVCDLDSVLEFGLRQVADRFELYRQGRFELVRDLVCHRIAQWNLALKMHVTLADCATVGSLWRIRLN